jgi:hypothetical protein
MPNNHPNARRMSHAGINQEYHSTPTPPAPVQQKTNRLSKKMMLTGGSLLAVLLISLGVWQYTSSQIMANRYQAVFLSNNQVYFGKLHGYYTSRPYMTDVYYFQANSKTDSNTSSAQGSQLLVKLGQEIHAPENKLILNKDSILFVENLTEGGKVTEAINKEANSQNTAQPAGGITR